MIREGVTGALKRKHTPFVIPPPITIEVDFAMTIHADMAELCPGAVRSGGRAGGGTPPGSPELVRAWGGPLEPAAGGLKPLFCRAAGRFPGPPARAAGGGGGGVG